MKAMKNLEELTKQLLPEIEQQLIDSINFFQQNDYHELYGMLRYHMGWEGEHTSEQARGKRVRPLLVLICAMATNQDWKSYLPLATAVELIHNFSLMHDDIEDNSELRRGRPTAWVKWGIPQTINAGDLLFTIAHLTLLSQNNHLPDAQLIQAARILHKTCILLTQGQFLDMNFETSDRVSVDEYWKMIEGKTAALISCCMELGALQAREEIRDNFKQFGRNIGLAFQIQDDLLGLWGESSITGKSSDSDLRSKKKTFPILYALQNNPEFHSRWQRGFSNSEQVREAANMLIEDGTYEYTRSFVRRYTNHAIENLRNTRIENTALIALEEFAGQLLSRIQ